MKALSNKVCSGKNRIFSDFDPLNERLAASSSVCALRLGMNISANSRSSAGTVTHAVNLSTDSSGGWAGSRMHHRPKMGHVTTTVSNSLPDLALVL